MNTERVGQVVMYSGSAGALWFGWDVNTWVAVIGALCAVGGLWSTIYFQRRRDRREQEAARREMETHEHQMRMYGEH